MLFLTGFLALYFFRTKWVGAVLLLLAVILGVSALNEALILKDVSFISNVERSQLIGIWSSSGETIELKPSGSFEMIESDGRKVLGTWHIGPDGFRVGDVEMTLMRYRDELRFRHLNDPDDLSSDLGFKRQSAVDKMEHGDSGRPTT